MSKRHRYLPGGSMRLIQFVWLAGIYVASAAVAKLAGYLILFWMAKKLSVEGYAKFGLMYAIQTGVGSFGRVGIIEIVIGSLKDHRLGPQQDRLFGVANTMFTLTALVACGAVWTLSVAFGIRQKVGDVGSLLAMAVGCITAFSALQAQMLRLREEHLRSLWYNFMIPFSIFAMGAIGFAFYRSAEAFFVGGVLAGVSLIVVLRAINLGHWGFLPRDPAVWTSFRKIPPFAIIAIFGWFSGYGANFLINKLATAPDVAKFTFLFTVGSAIQLLATSLNMVWSPRFYNRVHQDSASEVERANHKFFSLLGVAIGLAGGCIIALLPMCLDVFGENLRTLRPVSLEAFLLVTGYVLLIPWWHCQNYYLVFDKGRELRNNVILTGVLGAAAWITAIWMLGAIGIYIGFAMQTFLRSIGNVLGAKKFWTLSIAWEGVLIGVLLCGIGLLISHVWQ